MTLDAAVRDRLLGESRRAARSAYCPYSAFHVGAAVLTEDGSIYTGCNVENASYGLTICAERAAIFTAVAAGRRRIRAIAVSCPDAAAGAPGASRMPCGACRQVIAEFATSETVILVEGVGDFSLGDLLPEAFALPVEEAASG